MEKNMTASEWMKHFEAEERSKLVLDEETKQMALKWLRDHGENV